MASSETSVLIAGAGPVGLALACELGLRGIDCVLIEKRDGAITVPNEVPAALTSRTITDPGALAAELAAVRDRGYAVARGELEDGLDGLAVPVRDRPEMRTVCTAALCVSGPAYRMERRDEAGKV